MAKVGLQCTCLSKQMCEHAMQDEVITCGLDTNTRPITFIVLHNVLGPAQPHDHERMGANAPKRRDLLAQPLPAFCLMFERRAIR